LKFNHVIDLSSFSEPISETFEINLSLKQAHPFSIEILNDLGEKVVVGYEQEGNRYYIDRTNSGKMDFHREFGKRHYAPRLMEDKEMDLQLIVDVASVELFADGGRTVMTSIFFPNKDYDMIKINLKEDESINKISMQNIASIW